MSVLALAPWQVAALGAVTAAAVTWLFLLKLRHPRVAVSSLLLWRRAIDDHHPRSITERLRRLASLALALAIGLLLALAPSRPARGRSMPERGVPVTIVIDTSPSMASRTADGQTRLEHAKATARAFVLGADPASAIGLSDTSGTLTVPPGAAHTDLLRAVDSIKVADGPRWPGGATGAGTVLYLTDGVAPDPFPAGATRLSVFEPTDNVAVAAFDIRPVPSAPRAYAAYLDVVNQSRRAKSVEIRVGNDTAAWFTRRVVLGPGEHARDVVDTTGFESGAVRASVATDGDGFSLDDEAFAWMPSRTPMRTVLVTTGNRPLETLLSLDPGVDLVTIDPARFQPQRDARVYVFDRYLPPESVDAPALVIDPPSTGWLAGTVRVAAAVAAPAISFWGNHPLLAHVPSTDLHIDRARALVVGRAAAADVEVIAGAAGTPLIVAAVRPVKRVILGFDLLESDFPYQVGFPLFVQNALAWLADAEPPLTAAVGTVRVPGTGLEVTTAAGAPVPSRPALGATVFEAPKPGVYVARRGDQRRAVVVRLDDPAVPDVNRSTLVAQDAPVGSPAGHEFWRAMLLAAFALGTLEWWTYHRRVTV